MPNEPWWEKYAIKHDGCVDSSACCGNDGYNVEAIIAESSRRTIEEVKEWMKGKRGNPFERWDDCIDHLLKEIDLLKTE